MNVASPVKQLDITTVEQQHVNQINAYILNTCIYIYMYIYVYIYIYT